MSAAWLRGHRITFRGQWLYLDTLTCTNGRARACGYCGKPNTPEGHDGCLGTLPNVMNACCGHGQRNEAYVQFWSGRCIRGKASLIYIYIASSKL